ncbi:hypothetical protein A5893_00125 [Pedobacter psychrophilus]|uniref:DUF58 domain-containing protein n=1 Tax=Pedobacter psychrophilus TaxID=1826909 RepID=A0A179DM08_9SPHI|nr:DUF58 domain-containing protein [Pedobacter psychrophilus]OAQ41559.1 hypothetical protein A5893_00125 [Pedobacter psychrophilus]
MQSKEIDLDDLVSFGNLELLAQQIVEGFITGLHKSPFHGFSVEFAEHRLYNEGDSIKNIDWKLFAKTDKLFVKRFEEETNLRCQILIDHSASMYYPEKGLNKFQFSCLSAAAIINLLKKQRDAFGVSLFAEEIEFHTPTKSTTVHQKYILSELNGYLDSNSLKSKQTEIIKNLHLIAEQIHKRSLVVLFSDLFQNSLDGDGLQEIFSAIQHLKYLKNEVIIFNIHDKKHEIDFDFENRPYHFIDMETNEQIKLNPSQFKEMYTVKMADFKKEIALKCAQYKVDLIDANLEDGFYPVLNAWLIKRNGMN